MKVEYLDFISFQKNIEKCAFLFSVDRCIEEIKQEKRIFLFGTGQEGCLAKFLLQQNGIEITAYLDNFKGAYGRYIDGKKVVSPYEYFKNPNGYIIIAVPRQHINYVRLQLMIYNIEQYSIFFIEDFHSFSMDGNIILHNYIIEGVNLIGLEERKVLDAVPYVQISSGLDGGKLGNINYLLYSTTWTNPIYQWIYEEYTNKQEKSIVLEIGPGHGLLSYTLKKIYRNIIIDWVCFDSKNKVIRESNENYERSLSKISKQYSEQEFNIIKGYIESDNFMLTKTYDVIIMTEVFEHFVANPLGTMKKLVNALNKNGRLYLSTPNWGHLYMYDSWKEMKSYSEIGNEEKYLSMYAGHTYQYSKEELDEIFAISGLQVVKYALSDAQNHNYTLAKI